MIRTATSLSIALLASTGWTPGLDAQDLTGCWAGTMGDGTAQIRGAFEFAEASDGWEGSIHRMGAELDSAPFESVTVDGANVEVPFPSSLATAMATFRGTVEGASLSGTSEVANQSVSILTP